MTSTDRSSARISRDAYGLKLAEAAASRADCTRRQVGAVIVNDDGDIVATGYNGAPAGEPGCLSEGACPRGQMSYEDAPAGEGYEETKCVAIHAEVNAVIRASRSRAKGATIYVTDEPCYHCSIVIRAAGIVRVVTPAAMEDTDRLVIEAMARYLCRDYWRGDVARWDEFTGQAKDLLAIARAENPDIGEQHCDAARRTPRVFTADDPEPTDVAAVMDRDGYVWRLREGGQAFGPVPYTWESITYYAPLTEILPSEGDTQ